MLIIIHLGLGKSLFIARTLADYEKWREEVLQTSPINLRDTPPLSPLNTLGFVPTMGALHEGHLKLIQQSVAQNSFTVVSIFVNPIQFNQKSDFENYPITWEEDLQSCEAAGVDVLFCPISESMYPPHFSSYCDVVGLSDHLCGATRPGHFKGVCTVVLKLLNIIRPNQVYFGKKDYQQATILKRLVEDFNLKIDFHVVETEREKDGLALSSRNRRLTPENRKKAPILYTSLQLARETFLNGEKNAQILIEAVRKSIQSSSPTKIDYIEIVDQILLQPLPQIQQPALLAVAVFFGEIRLIDNIELV